MRTHLLDIGYTCGAPSREVENGDAPIAEGMPCPDCGGPMHYEGYHRRTKWGWSVYIALAVCNLCGRDVEF